MAYTVGYEHTRASVNGEPRQYSPSVTQIYRREAGDRKVVQRHADTLPQVPLVLAEAAPKAEAGRDA